MNDALSRLRPRLRSQQPLKRSDAIADEVKRWVTAERMQPGDRLPREKDLAAVFGCAKGTIREALKSLEVQGLITIRTGPHGGPTLAEVSYECSTALLRNYLHFRNLTAEQVYALRKIVEVEMAASAVGHLSEDDFAQLEANIAWCDDPTHLDGDFTRVREMELDFHSLLARACPDPLLSFLSRFLGDLLRDFIRFKEERLDDYRRFTRSNVGFHRDLIAAFRACDGSAVRRIMAAHMADAERHTLLDMQGFLAGNLLLPPQ